VPFFGGGGVVVNVVRYYGSEGCATAVKRILGKIEGETI
jgi:hypothetical protein